MSSFCNCKNYSHCFSKNISIYAILNDQSVNDTLTNNIVTFEQLGPVLDLRLSPFHKMDVSKLKDGRAHFRNSGVKGLKRNPEKNRPTAQFLLNGSKKEEKGKGKNHSALSFFIGFAGINSLGHWTYVYQSVATENPETAIARPKFKRLSIWQCRQSPCLCTYNCNLYVTASSSRFPQNCTYQTAQTAFNETPACTIWTFTGRENSKTMRRKDGDWSFIVL